MSANILDTDVTYATLTKNAADELYKFIKEKSNSITQNAIFSKRYCYLGLSFPDGAQIVSKDTVKNAYTIPTSATIETDIKTFMKNLSIFTDTTYTNVPTNSGLLAYVFALNYFIEQSIIETPKSISVDNIIEGYLKDNVFYKDSEHTTVITAETGKIYVNLDSNVTYIWDGTNYTAKSQESNETTPNMFLYYSPITSGYTNNIVVNPTDDNTVNSTKIKELYDTLEESSMLSKTGYIMELNSNTTSSSSCSSCSCSSSSWFIAFINLN